MSTAYILEIRQALEQRLAAISGALPTAWENVKFEPTTGVPYQEASVLPGAPGSPCLGSTQELVMESGIFQISLHYPVGEGLGDILTKAEEIRAWFSKGLTLTSGGVNVQIARRASVALANRDGEWVVCPISIPYFANIFV